jgi:hypothetical protein
METLNLMLVRERDGDTEDCFHLYACRGKEPHCAAQLMSNPSKPCSSCLRTDEGESITDLMARLERGNA